MAFKIKRETRVRISLVIGFMAFFFAGWDSLDHNLVILGVSNFLLAGANLISLFFVKEKGSMVNIILLLLNAILAFIVAFGYFDAGKKTLPLAWVIVGFLYLSVSVKAYKKSKSGPGNQNVVTD